MSLIFWSRCALFSLNLCIKPHNTITSTSNQWIPFINIMWRRHYHLMIRPEIGEIPFIIKRRGLFLLSYVCSISFTVIVFIFLNKRVDVILIICFLISLVGIRPIYLTLFVEKFILLFVHKLWPYSLLTEIGCIYNLIRLDMHVLLISRNISRSIL